MLTPWVETSMEGVQMKNLAVAREAPWESTNTD